MTASMTPAARDAMVRAFVLDVYRQAKAIPEPTEGSFGESWRRYRFDVGEALDAALAAAPLETGETVRAAVAEETRDVATAPKDGRPFNVTWSTTWTYKWSPYKPDGRRQMGKLGRWQRAGEYGGWENAELPDTGEWSEVTRSGQDAPVAGGDGGRDA